MSERYKVSTEVDHGCCYEVGVVDTASVSFRSNVLICECADLETAELICKALNALPDTEEQ